MPDLTFHTSISGEVDGELVIRGQKLTQLIASHSFSQALYLTLTGSEPTADQTRMLDAILVSCIDHTVAPASGFVPRVVAASGNEMTHALAAGVLAIGPYHGGAIQKAAELFEMLQSKGADLPVYVATAREQKQIFYGYGHKRYTTVDPRAVALFAKADELGIPDTHRKIATQLTDEIEKVVGKRLVLNIDGAIGALILDLGLPSAAGNGLFALSRMGGMMAQILEEYSLHSPVRRLDESQVLYTP